MRKQLFFILKYFLFWVAFFQAGRLLFLMYHAHQSREMGLLMCLKTQVWGLWLDCSMAGYLTVLPTLSLIFSNSVVGAPTNHTGVGRFIKGYTYFFVFLCTLLIIIDLELFNKWRFRLDATPLMYLKSPIEMWASVSSSPLGLIVLLGIGLITGGIWASRKLLNPSFSKVSIFRLILFCFVATALLFIPIRGGFQLSPLNVSSVAFSDNLFANQAAINVCWNVASDLVNDTYAQTNPYIYTSPKEATALVKAGLEQTNPLPLPRLDDSTNVLIIVWESLTAKVVASCGGLKNVTPNLTQLSKEGIFFNNAYATGDRSDKGLVGILSGYPAQPTASIMTTPKKAAKLPTLAQIFTKKGYETSFYYGGETEFANIKTYLLNGSFQKIIDKKSFAPSDWNSKWGAHDGVVFSRVLNDLNKGKKPFFTTFFTLSSHEPFEVPLSKPLISGTDETSLFLNSHAYTDQCLGEFIAQAKQQPWWKNTLVVIVADHGHPLPLSKNRVEDFKIPILFLGGKVEKPTEIQDIVSQIQIAHWLGMPPNSWSNEGGNIPAYFAFHNGFGLALPQRELIFDNDSKRIMYQRGKISAQDLDYGRAYQQLSFQDYLDK